MPTQKAESTLPLSTDTWSIRILLVSSAGILFLTLFPFRFAVPAAHTLILIGGLGKTGGILDVFLNILLFVPFGFGLAERLREHGRSKGACLLAALFAGAFFSYTIETLQIYVPSRDSGWADVITNTSGCVLGALIYELFGRFALRIANQVETALVQFLNPKAAALVFLVYFGIWLPVSFQLQTESRLTNWSATSVLIVDDPGLPVSSTSTARVGRVLRLAFWDRVLPRQTAAALSSGSSIEVAPPPLSAYDFTSQAPVSDQTRLLPSVPAKADVTAPYDSNTSDFDGGAWLASQVNASNLSAALQRANRLSLLLNCRSQVPLSTPGRILWLGPAEGSANLAVMEDATNLVILLRTPLSARRAQLSWEIPGVFKSPGPRKIALVYDGAQLTVFVDGKMIPRLYRLGPGAALARLFRWPRVSELEAYSDIYYSIVFFPAGALLGLGIFHAVRQRANHALLFALMFLSPPFFLEACLIGASGRNIQLGRILLSFFLLAAGAIWINADRDVSLHTVR